MTPSHTRSRANFALAVALAAGALLGPAPDAGAGRTVYTYVDADGVAHFTDVPPDERYTRLRLGGSGRPRSYRAPRHPLYDSLIGLAARQHRMPPALIKAVIAAESHFDPSAISHKGAQGLMQLMPETAAALGVGDPLQPSENVDGGVRYLRAMYDRYGDLPRALAAYNAGPSAVDRYKGVPPYPETRDYVRRVMTYYRQYHGDFGR